jgi:hypothetical protein
MIQKAIITALLFTSAAAQAQSCVSVEPGTLVIDRRYQTIERDELVIHGTCGDGAPEEVFWHGGLVCSGETIFVRGADGRMFPCWVSGF